MPNFLNLPSWGVESVKENARDFRVEATYTVAPDKCPKCGDGSLFAGQFYKHGTMKQEVMDTPSQGKRVGVILTRSRYRCRACGKTITPPVPEIDDRGTMTRRLVAYIERESLRRTFTSIANEVGVAEGTVRNLFHAHVEYLDEHTMFATPERLGIDEVHLLGQARAVFTNLEKRTIIGVLPDRTKKAVTAHLKTMSPGVVKVVAIDMTRAYRDAAKEVFPSAAVVVDKFHVVRMANDCLNEVRKSLRAGLEPKERRKLLHDRHVLRKRLRDLDDAQKSTLEGWGRTHPLLAEAHRLKEAFFDVWDTATTPAIAEGRFRGWEDSIKSREMTAAYRPLLTAWRNWTPEILAYFEHRETNAVTEALNGIARRIEQDGRGYSFDVMRAKMLYGTEHQKKVPYSSDAAHFLIDTSTLYPELTQWLLLGTDVDSLHAQLRADVPDSTLEADSEDPDE